MPDEMFTTVRRGYDPTEVERAIAQAHRRRSPTSARGSRRAEAAAEQARSRGRRVPGGAGLAGGARARAADVRPPRRAGRPDPVARRDRGGRDPRPGRRRGRDAAQGGRGTRWPPCAPTPTATPRRPARDADADGARDPRRRPYGRRLRARRRRARRLRPPRRGRGAARGRPRQGRAGGRRLRDHARRAPAEGDRGVPGPAGRHPGRARRDDRAQPRRRGRDRAQPQRGRGARSRGLLADAEERATTMVAEARATADRVRAESERELAAAAQRRDSINAQLSNVRQMLATLSGTSVPGVVACPRSPPRSRTRPASPPTRPRPSPRPRSSRPRRRRPPRRPSARTTPDAAEER